jgi:ketosteroid isomerase-like protein
MLRDDDVLALDPAAMVLRQTFLGTGVASGGAFENVVIAAITFDADGLIARTEVFERDQEAAALACFDGLVGSESAPTESPFANAAFRSVELVGRRWAARDWEGVLAILSPALRFDDRRRMMRLEIGYEDFVAQFRMLFDQPGSRWHEPLLATRGERLALTRTFFEAEVARGGGPLAFDDHLSVTEVDADGRWTATVTFDLDYADNAYAELDARYYAGEGATHPAHSAIMRAFTHAVVSRDWDPVLALCAPEFIEHDHRSLAVLGTTRGAAAWAQNFSTLVDLAPDTVYRGDHFRSAARGFCSAGTWVGSRDGGRYEIPLVAILELDDRDRLARADIYDPDQFDEALARFEALKALTPPSPFANAATRLNERVVRAWAARDWEAVSALHSSAVHIDDRRRFMRMRVGAEDAMAQVRFYFDVPGSRFVITPIATRGERLALSRLLFEGNVDDDGGVLAIDYLAVDEVDPEGRSTELVLFDANDLDAAFAELDARYAVGEGAAHPAVSVWRDFSAAFERRDWDAVAAVYSPSTVGHDHRLVGWGTLYGREAFLQSMRQMVELAPDARMRTDHGRSSNRGMLGASIWTGTREGGAFESPFIVVVEVDAHGRAVRNDFYDPHHLDRAWARFEEIGVSAASSSSAAIANGNAVIAVLDRWPVFDTPTATDWDALRASCAPDMVFEDRQGFARLSGDREMMIASLRERVANGARAERWLLGTAGERIAITRMLWTGGPADGRFEIEYLSVIEIDAAGLVVAIILFGSDDLSAALREALARWAAIDPVATPWVELMTKVGDAWNGRDEAQIRTLFDTDVVLEDHRHAGVGHIEGLDAWADSTVALWDLAPDQRFEFGWSWPAVDSRGFVVTARRTGMLADGGPFESEFVWLGLVRSGRFTRVELFEIDAIETALARFAELGAADVPSMVDATRK